MRTTWLPLLLALFVLSGCEALKPAPAPTPEVEAGTLEAPARDGLDTPRAMARKRNPSRWLSVNWPPELRLMESGVTGPASRPVLWYRFGLDGQDPERAAGLALDALESVSGEAPLRSLYPDADSGRVVGQLRSERFAASVVAEDSSSTRDLRVTIELLESP